MYIAMNRFRIAAGREPEFARVWKERKSYLSGVAGFCRFRLLEGEHGDTETIFISCSEWTARATFVQWTESEAFTNAHRSGSSPAGVVLAHPEFEGYEVVEERVP